VRRCCFLLSALLLAAPAALRALPGDAVIEACAGPGGQLRLSGEGCRPAEEPFAWQRGGGAWVHDAEGRPLGRSVGREGSFVRVYLDGLGLRAVLNGTRGGLLTTQIGFSEPDCQGVALGGGTPGDLVAPTETGPLYVVTERVIRMTRRSRLIGTTCQNLSPATFDFQEIVPLTGELGFTLPVTVPLQFGSGPLGPIAEELVHACARPRGRLRLAEGPDACLSGEDPLAWQRLGGLRVYDGLGRDVGAALGTNVVGTHGILLTESGVWIEPDPLSGVVAEPTTRAYAAPGCQGESFLLEFFQPAAGKVFAGSTPGAFVVTTAERLQDASYRSLRRFGACQETSGTDDGLRLVPYTGPLPELPLPAPLVVGFPGSPTANPAGPALPAALLHACAGPDGRLRAVDEGVACLPSERALRWPVRGGLRAQDAHGNELGAYLERASSNVVRDTMRIVDDASGLRFGVQHVGGQLSDDETVVSAELSYDAPFCRGTAFRFFEADVGHVFPFDGGLVVGTRLAPLVQRSARRTGSACEARTLFPEPFLSTVVEDFTGVVPFALPVATPLLVGPGN
jgi:hypothetical protein